LGHNQYRLALKGYWRIGKAEAVGLGIPGRRSKNHVNAKTSTGEVTVSGKNVKFSARTAQSQTLAV
jgi:hypothetical protein